MPKISVILTSFNHEKYIAETIDSILAQSFQDFELIVWDDCSSDRSWEIIQSYQDPRLLTFRNEERQRALRGINRAITEVARGTYIAIHHSDDVWEPNKLERQHAFLETHMSVGAVFTHAQAIDENSLPLTDHQHFYSQIFQQPNQTKQQWLHRFFYQGNALCHPSVLIRKLCYDECGPYKPWLAQLGAFDMWIRLCLKFDIHVLPESLVRFRVRDDEANASGNRPDTRARCAHEYFLLLNNYLQLNTFTALTEVFPQARQYQQRGEGDTRFALAMMALAENTPPWHRLFGLQLLSTLLEDPHSATLIQHLYAFDYQSFIRITGLTPAFAGLEATQQLIADTGIKPQPWLPAWRWSPTERSWAEETLASWPAFSCEFLLAKRHEADSVVSSLARLHHQWLKTSWRVVTLKGTLSSSLNPVMFDSPSEWLAIIDAGDTLCADATFRLAQTILQHPEWQIVYTDEDTLSVQGEHSQPHANPDFNLDFLRSMPYIGNLLLIRRTLFIALGGFDPQAAGAEEYDLLLRAWEKIGDTGIGHIPEVLYHRCQDSRGRLPIPLEGILQACEQSLARHLARLNLPAQVLRGPFPPSMRVRYELTQTPQVTIIIPTRNQLAFLCRCLESLIQITRYPAYDILVVDNDSDDPQTCAYLDLLDNNHEAFGNRIHVLRHPGAFNFSAMNNRAAACAEGEFLLLLNNGTGVLHDDWLDEMVGHALRPEVGVVGAKLLFPDEKIQHAGVVLGMKGPAEHPYIGLPRDERGHSGRAQLTQNFSAVTGACLLIRKSLYQQLGGLDETDFKVSYNDIDLCMKVRAKGHLIVWTPWAILLHEGSASQKQEVETQTGVAKTQCFDNEQLAFYLRWLPQLAFDPAYNRHLSLAQTDVVLEDQAALSWDPDWRPRPRLLAQPSDRFGCGEYRIIAPLRALRQAGMVQGFETMRLFQPAEMARFQPDSLILQRPHSEVHIEMLEKHKRLFNTFRIFEIDDLVTNLPLKSLHRDQMPKDIIKLMRRSMALCDRLVVSTEPLAQAYRNLADEVRIQPNYIDASQWVHLKPRRRQGTRPRVGWAGGIGHSGDLVMITDIVRELADEVDWVFFGMYPDQLDAYIHEIHPGVPLSDYPAKLSSLDLDLAIAPLEDNPFNQAKSPLKLLEYGILGFPVICSDITPYQNAIPVWRVANRHRDWIRTIREKIADRTALAQAGDELREYIRAHWLLQDNLETWLKAWLP